MEGGQEGREPRGRPGLDTSVHPSFLCYPQLITPNYTYLRGSNTKKLGVVGDRE